MADEVTKAKAPGREVGVSGLREFGGLLREELHRDLTGDRAIVVYGQMSYDPIVSATTLALGELIRSAGFTIEADDGEDAKKVEAAEYTEGCLDDMSHTWTDFWSEWSSTLEQGWSYFEIVYKQRKGPNADPPSAYDDGRVGWRKFAPRPQDTRRRWEFDENGGIQGMWQIGSVSGMDPGRPDVLLEIKDCLLFRTTHRKNSPEGRSPLRGAYEPWYYRRRMAVVSAIGIERNLAGIPYIKVPGEIIDGATPGAVQAKAQWEDVGKNLRVDEQAFILAPSDRDEAGNLLYEVSLLTAGSGHAGVSGTPAEQIIERLSREIAMSVLADVIFLGHEQIGTQALAEERGSLLKESLQGIADSIAEVFTNHAIPRLMRLNGFPREVWPSMKAGQINSVNLAALGTFIKDLAGAGFTLGDDLDLENALRRWGDLPERDEVPEDTLDPTAVVPGMPAVDPLTGLPIQPAPVVAPAAPPPAGPNGRQGQLPPASGASNVNTPARPGGRNGGR